MRLWFTWCALALGTWLHTVALAAPPVVQQSNNGMPNVQALAPVSPIDAADLPPELRAWVPWVTSKHPDLACPLIGQQRACLWPGQLEISANQQGARLAISVRADAEMPLPLPGGKGHWPQEVRVNGVSRPVLSLGGVPTVVLPKGRHKVTGQFVWDKRPGSLPLPRLFGQIALTVDGTPNPWPRIDEDGLRLGATEQDTRQDQRLDLEVSRKIQDGVPVVVETVVTLRASGSGREVDLGNVHLSNSTPVSLSANLPARFESDGRLIVQVRPGTYEVSFSSLHVGPVLELTRPPRVDPWPELETWAVQTDERTRAVNLSGPPGVDPARTTIPNGWKTLPVFSVAADTPLRFEELRRGEPDPAPNQLHLQREIWVDMDGSGWTIRDHFTGTMNQGWRLDVVPPAAVGHVAALEQDQVITHNGERTGVELRDRQVSVTAESRVDRLPTTMAAVGWDTDVQSLSATLHLPPGWTLLAGMGIDNLDGSVLDQWTLFDLFFVLILALATGRLFGPRWGLIALLALTLARHEADAPQWTWAFLLLTVGLGRVVSEGRALNVVQMARLALLLVLAALLLPFATQQARSGLFPVLDRPWDTPFDGPTSSIVRGAMMNAPMEPQALEDSVGGLIGAKGLNRQEAVSPKRKSSQKQGAYLSSQVDPAAVVQTGPGVPSWSWEVQPLSWSGPVSRDHTMSLFLIGPIGNMLLAFTRVILLIVLALKIAGLQGIGGWLRGLMKPLMAAGGALLAVGMVPDAHAQTPAPQLLTELEQRLTVGPDCLPHCAEVPRAEMRVADDTLVLSAEVHAAVDSSWPVPGPTDTWVPASITVDGMPTVAVRRQPDGFLHVRVPEGVHRVRIEGPLPPSDAVALAFGLTPQRLQWTGDGWALDGRNADGTVDPTIQLARMLGETTTAQSAENLSPWLEVQRDVDLGIPWRVRTTVQRVGPTDHPVTLKVPLLPGEAVTDSAHESTDGHLSVTLERDQRSVSWLSTLTKSESVTLTAPSEVPWTEVWTLSCSPVFACNTEGIAPLSHIDLGGWRPMWRAWPGESVTIQVSRPAAVEGQTTTIDRAELKLAPGRRQLLGTLSLSIRSSQGGRQTITLPPEAELQSVTIDGLARPLQLRDGSTLPVPLQPGTQAVEISWQQARPPRWFDTAPAIDLGGPAVNLTVEITPPEKRWIVALTGPRWGPVPLLWTYLLIATAIAWGLARASWSPLRFHEWWLLALGMTQLPTALPVLVAGWFLVMEWRRRERLANPLLFNLVQVGLAWWTLFAVLCLYAAIHSGLLLQPDMQVTGAGSSDRLLRWFLDRSGGNMPQPTVLSFPMWTWRLLMLAWSLWLAASMLRWAPWAWKCFSTGGWYEAVSLPKVRTKATAGPAPQTPEPEPTEAPLEGADTEITKSPEK